MSVCPSFVIVEYFTKRLTFVEVCCTVYSETTPGAMFDMMLELVADLGRHLFKLFQHPSLAIVKAAGLIMKAIIEVWERGQELCTMPKL